MSNLRTDLSDLRDKLWNARESNIGLSPYDADLFDIIDELLVILIDDPASNTDLGYHNTEPSDHSDTGSRD